MIPPNDFADIDSGRALGHDLYTKSLLPKQLTWPCAVREGFDAAAHAALPRHKGDRFVGKWLQLRLSAWQRGRVVADDVTPDLLRDIDEERCPVTRIVLTHGTRQDTDWSVDRLNNDGAYVAANLAVMSVRANRAKGALGFNEVYERSGSGMTCGALQPQEWLRLATLMLGPCFALKPNDAPLLPLCAPLSAHCVRLALQQIQRLFTEHCQRPAGKNRMIREFGLACHDEHSKWLLTRLAEAVHDGLKHLSPTDEVWDVWLQPRTLAALSSWRSSLSEAGWARAAATSGRLSAASRATPARLQTWHLPTRGYMPSRCF